MGSLRLNLLALFLLVTLIFLQYRLWFQPDGVRDLQRLKQKIAEQQMENQQLKLRNEALALEIKRLHNNPEIYEAGARNELGMVKKGETYYQIVK